MSQTATIIIAILAGIGLFYSLISSLLETITKEISFFRKERIIKKAKIKVTQDVARFMNNPNISNQGKESLRQQWEEFQFAFMQQQIQELNVPMELP